MLVKGIVEKIDSSGYFAYVRIPQIHRMPNDPLGISTEELDKAKILCSPGLIPSYKIGDIVYVDFENDEIDSPVITGLLSRNEAFESTGTLVGETLVNIATKEWVKEQTDAGYNPTDMSGNTTIGVNQVINASPQSELQADNNTLIGRNNSIENDYETPAADNVMLGNDNYIMGGVTQNVVIGFNNKVFDNSWDVYETLMAGHSPNTTKGYPTKLSEVVFNKETWNGAVDYNMDSNFRQNCHNYIIGEHIGEKGGYMSGNHILGSRISAEITRYPFNKTVAQKEGGTPQAINCTNICGDYDLGLMKGIELNYYRANPELKGNLLTGYDYSFPSTDCDYDLVANPRLQHWRSGGQFHARPQRTGCLVSGTKHSWGEYVYGVGNVEFGYKINVTDYSCAAGSLFGGYNSTYTAAPNFIHTEYQSSTLGPEIQSNVWVTSNSTVKDLTASLVVGQNLDIRTNLHYDEEEEEDVGCSLGSGALIVGDGLKSYYHNGYRILLGRYNKETDLEDVIVVGNGTDSTHRSNLIEITKGGLFRFGTNTLNPLTTNALESCFVVGQYNTQASSLSKNPRFVVGCGTSSSDKKDGLVVYDDGSAKFGGVVNYTDDLNVYGTLRVGYDGAGLQPYGKSISFYNNNFRENYVAINFGFLNTGDSNNFYLYDQTHSKQTLRITKEGKRFGYFDVLEGGLYPKSVSNYTVRLGCGTDSSHTKNALVIYEDGTVEIPDYQKLLVSGVNLKTINNQSLLGSGNIDVTGGGGSGNVDDVRIMVRQ